MSADGIAGAVALAALAATAALAVFCFVKVVGLVLLGPPRRASRRRPEAPVEMRAAVVALAGACVVLGLAPGLLFGSLVGLAPWPADAPTRVGLELPGTGSLPTAGIAVALVGARRRGSSLLRGRRSAAPAPTWACGQLVEPRLEWTSAGFTKPLRLMLEVVLRPQREIVVRDRRRRAGGLLQRARPAPDRRPSLPARRRGVALAAAAQARRLQSGRLGTYVAYLIGLVVVLLAAARIGVIG